MNVDGSNAAQIAPNASDPSWSPDGTRIAFARPLDVGDFRSDIFTMNPDGGNVVNVTNTPQIDEEGVSWSPEGDRLVFSTLDANGFGDITTINPDGTGRQPLTTSPGSDAEPVWQDHFVPPSPPPIPAPKFVRDDAIVFSSKRSGSKAKGLSAP